jgi:hypothetical protein
MTTNTKNIPSIDDFSGTYGVEWNTAILVDVLDRAVAAGLVLRTMPASGRQYLTGPQGGRALPVVCGDIIEVWTEDGRMDGRCGLPVLAGLGACEGHAQEREAWLAMSERERDGWERLRDSWGA